MTSANVTLTPLQYGKPIIVITGTLTANLNLIFPAIVNEWTVINNTTGAFTITCKTATGAGVVVNTSALIVGTAPIFKAPYLMLLWLATPLTAREQSQRPYRQSCASPSASKTSVLLAMG
jgi:hypothetical protein